jgi:hypothetical protein
VLGGTARLDDISDLSRLLLVKRGARPPVRQKIKASGPCSL